MGRVKVAVGGYDRHSDKFNKNLEYLKNWEFSLRIYMQKVINKYIADEEKKKIYRRILCLLTI